MVRSVLWALLLVTAPLVASATEAQEVPSVVPEVPAVTAPAGGSETSAPAAPAPAAPAVAAPTTAAPAMDPQAAASVPDEADPNAYRLNYGDSLEFSVRGFGELRHKALIEIDGVITLPLAGRVKVAGLTLSEAQSLVKRLATQRPLRLRTPDGRESYLALSPDDVLLTQADYRPIYVMGDIAKPGELPFRPGMTVRQAVALGGGFDIMRYRLVNPFMQSTELKSQHEVLWTQAARARMQLKRVEAELDGKTEFEPGILDDIPLDRSFLDELLKTESETLKRQQNDYAKELEHRQSLIELNVAKVDTLKKQLDAEVKGTEVDQQELDQLKDAQRRGNLPLMRLMEIRRIQLTNATRVLQTRVQYDQSERELSEAKRAIERLKAKHRTDLLTQRQDQLAAYNALLSQISANAEKLVHTSLLKSRLVRGPGARVKIAIYRVLSNKKETIPGTEDSQLLPGDTVEVTLDGEREADEILRHGNANPATPHIEKSGAAAERSSALNPDIKAAERPSPTIAPALQ